MSKQAKTNKGISDQEATAIAAQVNPIPNAGAGPMQDAAYNAAIAETVSDPTFSMPATKPDPRDEGIALARATFDAARAAQARIDNSAAQAANRAHAEAAVAALPPSVFGALGIQEAQRRAK
jgi:hypothetical protein